VEGEVVKGERATAKGADRKDVNCRIIEECIDLRVGQSCSKWPPVRENADCVAVGNGDRALRIGDVVEAADEERVYAIVGNEFERGWSDDAGRQIGGEIGE